MLLPVKQTLAWWVHNLLQTYGSDLRGIPIGSNRFERKRYRWGGKRGKVHYTLYKMFYIEIIPSRLLAINYRYGKREANSSIRRSIPCIDAQQYITIPLHAKEEMLPTVFRITRRYVEELQLMASCIIGSILMQGNQKTVFVFA